MKEDALDKFVRDHAKEFDTHEPPKEVWITIEKNIFRPKRKISRRLVINAFRVAAAVLIFAAAWMLNDYRDSRKQQLKDYAHLITELPAELKELSDTEAFYASQIRIREEELESYAQEYPDIIDDLREEFLAMDLHRNELENDLAESNADEKVIEAIIRTYRIKLEILDQILRELQKTNANDAEELNTLL